MGKSVRWIVNILQPQQLIFHNQMGNSNNSDIQTWAGFWYLMIFQTFEHNFNLTTEARQIFQNLIWHLKGRGNLNPLCWYGSHFSWGQNAFRVNQKILIDHTSCISCDESRIFCVANATLAVNEQRMELDETGWWKLRRNRTRNE